MKPALASAALASAAFVTLAAPTTARAEPLALVEPQLDLLWIRDTKRPMTEPRTSHYGGGLVGGVGYAIDNISPFQAAGDVGLSGSVYSPELNARSFTATLRARGGFELPPLEASLRTQIGYGYLTDAGVTSHGLFIQSAIGLGGRFVLKGGDRTLTLTAVVGYQTYVGRLTAQGLTLGLEVALWLGEHRDLWWYM